MPMVHLLEENQRAYVSAKQRAATTKKYRALESEKDYPTATQVLPRAPENANILLLGLAWSPAKSKLCFQLYRSRQHFCTSTGSGASSMVVYLPALDAFGIFMPTDSFAANFCVDGAPPRMAFHPSMNGLVCAIIPHGSVVSLGKWKVQMFYAHWASDPAKWQHFGTAHQSGDWMNRVMTAPSESYFLTAEIEKSEQFRNNGRRCLLRQLAECPATQQTVLGFVAQYDIKPAALASLLKSYNTEKELDVAGFLDSEKTRSQRVTLPTLTPTLLVPTAPALERVPAAKLVRKSRSPSPAPPQVTPLGPLPKEVCWSPEFLANYLCVYDMPNPEMQLAAQKAAATVEFAEPVPDFVIDALPSLPDIQFGQVQALYEAACAQALKRLSIWPQRLCLLPPLNLGRSVATPYDEICIAAEIARHVLNPGSEYPIKPDKGLRWWLKRRILDLGVFKTSTPTCWEPVFLFGMCAGLAWAEYRVKHQEGVSDRTRLFKNLVACSTTLLESAKADDEHSFVNRFRDSWQASAIQDETELPVALERVETCVREARWIELLAFWFGDCHKLAQHIAAYEIALNMSPVLLAEQFDSRVAFVLRDFETTKFGQQVSWNVREEGPRIFGVPCSLIFQEAAPPSRSFFHQTAQYLGDEAKSPDEREFLPHELDFNDVYFVLHDEVYPPAAIWGPSTAEVEDSDADQEEEDQVRTKSAKRGREDLDDDYVPTQETANFSTAVLLQCSDGSSVKMSAWLKDFLSLSNVSADEYLDWRAFGMIDGPDGWEETRVYEASNFESFGALARFFDALIQKDPFLDANSNWWHKIAVSFQIPVQECKAIALDPKHINRVAAAWRQTQLGSDAKRTKITE